MLADDDPAASVLIGSGLSSEVFLHGTDRVLKLYREPSEASAIENEFRATALAHERGLPAARPIALLRRDGRHGILFERLHGETMLRHYAKNPLGMMLALRRLALIQYAMHGETAGDLPAQRERLRNDIGQARVPEVIREAALVALDQLPGGVALCHNDIHPGNVLCTPDGLALIDWQKAGAGCAAGDVARTELMIRYGRLPAHRGGKADRLRGLAADWYVRCYRSASGLGRAEIRAWHLPLMVARLCARRTDKDEQILGVVDRLMKAA
ncbi:phosphotransferase [Methylobacterium sp. C25]|uniref:phosphotransferase family protein n=1 Tax=Methylobacterium sp. C25 TaxID=2721622 RepID=UPI001F4476BC|nr:phosphotransferase [Methylobacterium sp. C25]MCE4223213.1 phosphotransferase [Methylobacterium sp. C25]